MFAGDWDVLRSPNNKVIAPNGVLGGSRQGEIPALPYYEITSNDEIIETSDGEEILVTLFTQ
jgi:hypothetical protein